MDRKSDLKKIESLINRHLCFTKDNKLYMNQNHRLPRVNILMPEMLIGEIQYLIGECGDVYLKNNTLLAWSEPENDELTMLVVFDFNPTVIGLDAFDRAYINYCFYSTPKDWMILNEF